MKILFLIIIFFQITHVNADEIYNLLKIPNLEVYRFKNDNNSKSSKFFRITNEIPTILLILIVFLAILKPF